MGSFASGAHHVGSEPVTEQKTEGLENEAFAGAGFARKGVHARAEVQFHIFNEGQILYMEIFQHDVTSSVGDPENP